VHAPRHLISGLPQARKGTIPTCRPRGEAELVGRVGGTRIAAFRCRRRIMLVLAGCPRWDSNPHCDPFKGKAGPRQRVLLTCANRLAATPPGPSWASLGRSIPLQAPCRSTTTAARAASRWRRLGVERCCDPRAGELLLAGKALRVDLEQHSDAVARPLGDLRRRHTGVQPGRHSRVTKVVRPGGQWRPSLLRRQARSPRAPPHPAVRALRERPVPDSPEEQAICVRSEPFEVFVQ
jgi:hypothetical protein